MQVLLRESIEDHVNNLSSHDRLAHSKTISHLLLDSKAKRESQYTKISQGEFLQAILQESFRMSPNISGPP